jgi:hypothetical protein
VVEICGSTVLLEMFSTGLSKVNLGTPCPHMSSSTRQERNPTLLILTSVHFRTKGFTGGQPPKLTRALVICFQ